MLGLRLSTGVTYDELYRELIRIVGQGSPVKLNNHYMTNSTKRILARSCSIAEADGCKKSSPQHLLGAMVGETSCTACIAIKKIGGNLNGICCSLSANGSEKLKKGIYEAVKPKPSQLPNLFKYGRNLTDAETCDSRFRCRRARICQKAKRCCSKPPTALARICCCVWIRTSIICLRPRMRPRR